MAGDGVAGSFRLPGNIRRTERAPARWNQLLAEAGVPRSGLHVTDSLGCPRKRALILSGSPIDYSRLESRLFGTALHGLLEEPENPGSEVDVTLQLGGHSLIGRADVLDGAVVADYKGKGSDSFVWAVKKKEGPPPEHVWQVEAYRLGFAQSGKDTTGGRVHHGAWTSGKWPKWVTWEWSGPVYGEEALLGFRPHGGSYTVADILSIRAADSKDPAEIPLVGSSMYFSENAPFCNYCEVQGPCGAIPYRVEL